MSEYLITVKIDVDADSPIQAAYVAWDYLQDLFYNDTLAVETLNKDTQTTTFENIAVRSSHLKP